MNYKFLIALIVGYFLVLIGISFFTSKKNITNEAFFKGNNQSPWYIVAFGMIGASLSGVTFISVPGGVEAKSFSYMQMVFGYFFGYIVIAQILLPLYYRLQLTSIYTYLQNRFGRITYKTGSTAFLVSRTIGAAFRLFLVANILHPLIFEQIGVPYSVTVIITILLIWVYTFRSGIKTIIWTDTLQTAFMLLAVGITIYQVCIGLDIENISSLRNTIDNNEMSQIFFFDDFNLNHNFWKNFIAGMFITIVMTGLDQDMMQKNLSCKNLKEAKLNMMSFSVVLIIVNFLFLVLGLLLTIYAKKLGLDVHKDQLFSTIALLPEMGKITAGFFILGMIAAAYSSADSALTSLTTSFCIDILEIDKKSEEAQQRIRKQIHIVFSVVLILVIIAFKALFKDESIIWELFKVAGYTYGPLLGLYAFGLFTKIQVKDKWVWLIALIAPILAFSLTKATQIYTYFTNSNLVNSLVDSESLWEKAGDFAKENYYQFGFEILIVNGLLMFLGLYLIRTRKNKNQN